MENLSNSNSENEEEIEQEENIDKTYNNNKDDYENISYKKKHSEYFSENDKNENSNDSAYTDISFGRLECHEEFTLKKIPKNLKNIPKLKIYNINRDNIEEEDYFIIIRREIYILFFFFIVLV